MRPEKRRETLHSQLLSSRLSAVRQRSDEVQFTDRRCGVVLVLKINRGLFLFGVSVNLRFRPRLQKLKMSTLRALTEKLFIDLSMVITMNHDVWIFAIKTLASIMTNTNCVRRSCQLFRVLGPRTCTKRSFLSTLPRQSWPTMPFSARLDALSIYEPSSLDQHT